MYCSPDHLVFFLVLHLWALSCWFSSCAHSTQIQICRSFLQTKHEVSLTCLHTLFSSACIFPHEESSQELSPLILPFRGNKFKWLKSHHIKKSSWSSVWRWHCGNKKAKPFLNSALEFPWTRERGHWFHRSAYDYGAESAAAAAVAATRRENSHQWNRSTYFSGLNMLSLLSLINFPAPTATSLKNVLTAATTEAVPIKTTSQISSQSSRNVTEADMNKLDALFF